MSDEQAPEDGPLDFVDGKLKFPLKRAVNAHNSEIQVLELREPDGKDIISVGNPILYDPISDPPRIVPDAQKMATMIGRLANIPPSAVSQISPKEQTQIAWILAPFFVPI